MKLTIDKENCKMVWKAKLCNLLFKPEHVFIVPQAGDSTRKIYEKKCSRMRNQDVRGDDELTIDKTRAAVKDLYARILVAIRSAESISKRIEKLRDEELQPQIVELLKG